MTTENEIKVEVNAVDNASAVVLKAAENAEAAMKKMQQEQDKAAKQTQQNFRNTKASVEFFGVISNLSGGTGIASIASQMAGLTEKTAQFNEVAKLGGSAAVAMKVGIAGAAAAMSFQLGKAIGDVIFETERWNRELERAEKTAKRLESLRMSQLSEQASDFRASLEFEEDPIAAVQERIRKLGVDMSNLANGAIPATKNELDKLYDAGSLGKDSLNVLDPLAQMKDQFQFAKSFVDNNATLIRQGEEQLANQEAQLEQYRKEKHELERLIGLEEERKQRRLEATEVQTSSSTIESLQRQYEQLQATLSGSSTLASSLSGVIAADAEEAMTLLQEIENTQAAIKQQQEEEAGAKRLATLKENELSRLQEELILLEQGKKAAAAFRLEKQGLSKADAEQIADAQALIDRAKEEAESNNVQRSELQGKDTRLLVRGPDIDDPQKLVAQNTQKQVEQNAKQTELLSAIKQTLAKLLEKDGLEVAVVQ